MLNNEIVFFSVFMVFIGLMLLLDLGVFSRKSHVISFREATIWSVVWVVLALGFYFLIKLHADWIHGIDSYDELARLVDKFDQEAANISPSFTLEENLQLYRNHVALEFITGYLLEYSLSADNIFVIILIFNSFGVREKYYKKVLFWGIVGALLMRFIFIFLGYELIEISYIHPVIFGKEIELNIVLLVFGFFLLYTGIKSLIEALRKKEEEKIEPQKHPVVLFASKYFSVYPRYVSDKFFIKKMGKIMLTPLFLVVLIVEFTDLLFAVDSIPAVYAVTKDPYVVFFSNIFAIMGLRSMFFFLSNIMGLFHYLKVGLGFLLSYIGVKMILGHQLKEWGFQPEYSIYIILGILATSIIASLLFPPKKEEVIAPSSAENLAKQE